MDDRFVNLGEVILTLLWQSGASESATVCFVISLIICYWLFKCWVLLIVCVCALVCVCVCVWERERERERVTSQSRVCVCVCVCSCVCERGRHGHITTMACVQTHTSFITVCHVTLFPSRAWTDGKTKDIINCLYIYFESWSSRLWRGVLHLTCACGVRPITMHCASWPIRADCACRKEGLCRKRSRGGA